MIIEGKKKLLKKSNNKLNIGGYAWGMSHQDITAFLLLLNNYYWMRLSMIS